MALFKRADLKAQGLTDEQIEFVMTEGNRSLAKNYTLNSDVQAQIEAAAQNAPQQPADVKTTPEYVELARERDMLRAIGGEDFAGVKPKFRETVFSMLDRGEKAAPVPDQLKAIGEKYEEYFISPENGKGAPDAPKNTPVYSQPPGRDGVNPTSAEDELYSKLKAAWK